MAQVLGAAQHHLGHRAVDRSARRDAGFEQAHDLLPVPVAHPGLVRRGKRGRIPVLHRDQAAGQTRSLLGGAQRVARAVAGAAVAQALHQVRTAVPLGTAAGLGPVDARLEIQRPPHCQGGLRLVGEAQRVGQVGLRHGGLAGEVGKQRV